MAEQIPVTYTCKGRPYTEAERTAKAQPPEDPTLAARGIKSKAIPIEQIPEREPCGRDITALLMAVPEDGRDYDVACPCGKITIAVKRTPPA